MSAIPLKRLPAYRVWPDRFSHPRPFSLFSLQSASYLHPSAASCCMPALRSVHIRSPHDPVPRLTLHQVQEIVIDYTDCRSRAGNGTDFSPIPSDLVKSSFKPTKQDCPTSAATWKGNATTMSYQEGTEPVDTLICSVEFSIPTDLHPPVLLYYRLTNFYQNHRRYVKSLDSDQLKGTAVAQSKTGTCDPLRQAPNNKTYYPCGLIANSVFNDTFKNPIQLNVHNSSLSEMPYNMTDKGIAWSSDTEHLYGQTSYNYDDIAPPPNWYLRYQKGYSKDNPPPNLKDDEPFQVWMMTAGLPNFSKLALRNDK